MRTLYFCPAVSSSFLSFFLFFLAQSQPSQIVCLPYFHTWCGLSANLRCRSEMCCTQLAENTGHKNSPKNRHLGSIAQLCRAISSQLRPYRQLGKNLLSRNISSTGPYNMVNFGPLAAAEPTFTAAPVGCELPSVHTSHDTGCN